MVFSKVLPLLFLSFASVIDHFKTLPGIEKKSLWQYDFCELANGDVGQCLHILDCPAAQEDLKKRIRPRICGYDGLYTIVCCKLCEPPLEILPTPSPTTHFNQPTTFQAPHTIQPVVSRGQLTTTKPIDVNNVTQEPVTQAMSTSSTSGNIKNFTQQPVTQATPTSTTSVNINKVTQQPVTQAVPTSTTSVNINTGTQQPVTQATPTATTSVNINKATQQPVTQAVPTSSTSVNINTGTQQPVTQVTPTSSTPINTSNGPFTSALNTKLPTATTEAAVNTVEGLSSRTSPLTTEQPLIQTSSVMTTGDASSGTEELSEQKCQEYINFVTPTTPASFDIRGVRAVPKQFPHMAALGYGADGRFAWQCGGSLISEQFVLTAAHCLSFGNLGDVRKVRLGDLDIYATNESSQRQEFNVTDTYPHPDYSSTSYYNDIALLKLDRPVIFSDFVSPACLQRNFNINGDLTTTGWATEEIDGQMQSFLQKADLYTLSANICVDTYEPQRMLERGFDKDTQICGGNLVMLVDTCQSDSGGPLQRAMISSRVSYRIVGVASYGLECGIEPGIYTRVSSYIPWIESIVWNN